MLSVGFPFLTRFLFSDKLVYCVADDTLCIVLQSTRYVLCCSRPVMYCVAVDPLQLQQCGEVCHHRGDRHDQGPAAAHAADGVGVHGRHPAAHLRRAPGLCAACAPGSHQEGNQEEKRRHQSVCTRY